MASRVLLRPPAPGDQEEWIAAVRRSRELHRPWIQMADTPDSYATYVKRSRAPDVAFHLACRREDGAIVGFFNLSEMIRGKLQQAFLGYGAMAGFGGQGYMTEGMRLLLREAFVHHKLHRLEANIQPANLASIRLVERCGFEKEGFSPKYLKIGGRWRDHERWAIRADNWR